MQVLSGRLRFTVDGEDLDAGPGYWLYVMLLTLVTGGRG